MIRLGSLAGYSFEGPRLLAGWTPPPIAGVYAILYRPSAEVEPEHYAVLYVGHSHDLSSIGLPFAHPRAPCWITRAGNKWHLYVASYEIMGGQAAHREQIVAELASVYRPGCNETRYDKVWKREWIGDYSTSTTGPLNTNRNFDDEGSPPMTE